LLLSAVLQPRAAALLLPGARRFDLYFCAYGAQQQTRRMPLLRSTDGTD